MIASLSGCWQLAGVPRTDSLLSPLAPVSSQGDGGNTQTELNTSLTHVLMYFTQPYIKQTPHQRHIVFSTKLKYFKKNYFISRTGEQITCSHPLSLVHRNFNSLNSIDVSSAACALHIMPVVLLWKTECVASDVSEWFLFSLLFDKATIPSSNFS